MNQSNQTQPTQHHPNPPVWMAQVVLSLITTTMGLAIADSLLTGQPLSSQSITGRPAAAQQPRLRWTPRPERGNATGTLSGGKRGQESARCGPAASATRLSLLVPTGRESLITTQAQPTLSWQITTQKPTNLSFILSDIQQPTPIYTKTLSASATGIQSVTLPSSVSLANGQTYRWTVLVNCPDGQKSEIYARSFISKTSGESLGKQMSQRSALDQAAIFAEKGIWYDALGQLLKAQTESLSANTSANNKSSAAALSMLLEQAVPGVVPIRSQR